MKKLILSSVICLVTLGVFAQEQKNTPLYICKKIRHFLRSADISTCGK